MTEGVKSPIINKLQSNLLMRLSKSLKDRLRPSEGVRPGRPSDPSWNLYGKLPMSEETVQLLSDLAKHLSADDRKVSPMQIAAHLLEVQLKKYSMSQTVSHGKINKCA